MGSSLTRFGGSRWLAATMSVLLLGTATSGQSPTFNRDVAPILFEHCASCHRPGEVGPFPLLTYQDARRRARQIALVVERGLMPPWKPSRGHEEFLFARQLEDQQKQTLIDWAKSERREGEAGDLPPLPEFPVGWHLGEPDLVVQVERPFVVPAEGDDIYIHFVIPVGLTHGRYVRAVQVLPSNRRVAHHGVIMLETKGKARKLAQAAGGDRYVNFGGPGFLPAGFLPGYAPGVLTRINPNSNTSIKLPKEADLVLQMHYHPIGREAEDQPQIGLYFTDTPPERNPVILLLANNDIDIPAGESGFERSDSFKLPCDYEVRDIWGHMHMIGKRLRAWAELPDGSTRELLLIDDWDFNWQDTYFYRAPFTLPRGTTVVCTWRWDNAADNPVNPHSPPERIIWGEGSEDEMSGLIIGGVTKNPRDEGWLWIRVLAHYLHIEASAKAAAKKRAAAGP